VKAKRFRDGDGSVMTLVVGQDDVVDNVLGDFRVCPFEYLSGNVGGQNDRKALVENPVLPHACC
jgi:hypothetical protein